MRFAPGQRVQWTSRSGILLRGAVVGPLQYGQWAVRPDGCSVEHAVDRDALSAEEVRRVAPALRVVKPLPPSSPMRLAERQHGIRATYWQGCKCRLCRNANARYRNDLRRRQAGEATG